MILSALIVSIGTSTVSATILHVEHDLDEDEVIARYKNECAGRDINTGTCKSQRRDLEEVYFMEFRRMTVSRKKGAVDRKYIVLAAQAQEFPALKEIGLWTLNHEGNLSDEEKKLFAAELNSPYPSLRKIAWKTLLSTNVSGRRFDETTLGVDRAYRNVFGKFEDGAPRGMIADRPPEPEWMMVPPFPEGEILYYASGKGGAIYETEKPAAEVLDFYKKKGLEVIGIKEMLEQINTIMSKLQEQMMAKMTAGANPADMEAEMNALVKSMQEISAEWLPTPRHTPKDMVLVGEPITVAGQSAIKPYAVVWTHPTIKKVGIAIPYDPKIWGDE
jgi:hypothetical protein